MTIFGDNKRLRERALDEWATGKSSKEIGDLLGVASERIRTIAIRARAKGDRRAMERAGTSTNWVRFTTSYEVRRALEVEANRRGINPSQLAAEIVKTVVAEKLFAAVLDE